MRVPAKRFPIAISVISLLFLCAALGAPVVAYSQTNRTTEPPKPILPMYVGGGISGVFNDHSTSLPVYRSVGTLCGEFTGGNSILPDGWLLFETPLGQSRSSLWMAPRLELSDESATLTTRATDDVRGRDPVDSSLVATRRVHELALVLIGAGADLFVAYPITSSLYLFGGPSVSWLLTHDIEQTERITEPSNAVFVAEGSASRTIASGEMPNTNQLQASLTAGTRLDIPLSSRVLIAPELSVTLPLSSLRSDVAWHITRIALGVGLKFDVSTEPELVVVRQPEAPKPTSEMSGTVALSGVIDSAGKEIEIPNPQLRVEETARREAYPLLNYVFFDSGSSVIPSRYDMQQSVADTFTYASLSSKSELQAYHEILNVIGKRLQDNPSSTIALTGSAPPIVSSVPAPKKPTAKAQNGKPIKGRSATPAAEPSTTRETLNPIARARAEAVKSYLVSTWKIDGGRISTAGTSTPRNAASNDTKEGREENNRVEITSSDPALLEPVAFETVDRAMNPPKLRIRTTLASKYPLKQYTLSLAQGDRTLVQFNSAHDIQDWTPAERDLPSTAEPLRITLSLRDSLGTSLVTSDSAHIDQLTIKRKREERLKDKIIERYNLITFDFDKADLDDRSQRIVTSIARDVTPGDKIDLRGYTDLVGEAAHNQKLSEDRAQAVRSALIAAIGSDKLAGDRPVAIEASGEGRADIVDNHLPEGRFLSRTVQVRIERPIQ
jgi:outer membrane protein OmpA-like peptidoglycan-associated protein